MKTKIFPIISLLIVILIGYVSYTFYGNYLPSELSVLKYVVAVFNIIVYGSFINSISSILDFGKMKKSFNMQNTPNFKDGKKVIIFGQILPINNADLVSPITKQRCLFYNYSVFHEIKNNNEKQEIIDFYGTNLYPSYVLAGPMKVKILGYPTLENFEEQKFTDPTHQGEYYSNIVEYINTNSFEQLSDDPLSRIKNSISVTKEFYADDDGAIKKNISFASQNFDIRKEQLSEQIIKPGEEVCVIGTWNSAKQSLIVDFKTSIITIIKGKSEEIFQQTKNKAFRGTIAALAFALLGNGTPFAIEYLKMFNV